MNSSPLNKARNELIEKILQSYDKITMEELDKRIVHLVMEDRKTVLKKLLGLTDDPVETGNRNNQRSPIVNTIQAELSKAFEMHIKPELEAMVKAERETILAAIRAEFFDSGYIQHKARSFILEQGEDWIEEAAKRVMTNIEQNILKESYDERVEEANTKSDT